MLYVDPMWNLFFHCSFSSVCFQHTPLFIPLRRSKENSQKKQISLLSAFGLMNFLELTKSMMTVMNKPSDPNSDSDGADTPAHTKSKTNYTLKHSNNTKFKRNIKSKILFLKTKDIIQRSSPKKSASISNISLT